jgi:hypothetical protein
MKRSNEKNSQEKKAKKRKDFQQKNNMVYKNKSTSVVRRE